MDVRQAKSFITLAVMALHSPMLWGAPPELSDWTVVGGPVSSPYTMNGSSSPCRIDGADFFSGGSTVVNVAPSSNDFYGTVITDIPAPSPDSDRDTIAPEVMPPARLRRAFMGPVGFIDLDPAHGGQAPSVTDNQTETFSYSPLIDTVIGPLAAGHHQLNWFARDEAGNIGQGIQHIDILPFANLSVDQTVGKGGEVRVYVYLSGEAPHYPVRIPYTVSGSASAEDHDAKDGTIVIDEGTVGSMTIEVFEDDITEIDETIAITMGSIDHAVAGSYVSHIITITDRNLAPTLTLSARQGGDTTQITPDGGIVILTATAHDPNPGDSLLFDWSQSDQVMGAPDCTEPWLEMDPSSLTPGDYRIQVSAIDDGEPGLQTQAELWLNVVSEPEVSEPNNSLKPSQISGYGTTEYPSLTGKKVINEYGAEPGAIGWSIDSVAEALNYPAMITTQEGLVLKRGLLHREIESDNHTATLSWGDMPQSLPADVSASAFLTSLEILGLANTGQSVDLVIPQEGHGDNKQIAQLLTYSTTFGLNPFVEDRFNRLASSQRIGDFCPPPGSDQYQSGLADAFDCIQITVEDGGPNDADGYRNGSLALNVGLVTREQDDGPPPPTAPEEGDDVSELQEKSNSEFANTGVATDVRSGAGSTSWLWLAITALALGVRHTGFIHRMVPKGK